MVDSSTTKRHTRSVTKRQTPATDAENVENPLLGPPQSPTPTNPPKRVRGGSTARLSPIPEKKTKGRKGRRGGGVPKPSPILEKLLQDRSGLRDLLDGQDLSTAALERLSASEDLVEIVEEMASDPFIPSLAICALLESEARVSAAVEARRNEVSGDALREVIWSKDEQALWNNPNFPLERVALPPMPSFPSPSPHERFRTTTDATVDGALEHHDGDRTPSEVQQAVAGDLKVDLTDADSVGKGEADGDENDGDKNDGDKNEREGGEKASGKEKGDVEVIDGDARVQDSVEPDTKGKGKVEASSGLPASTVCRCVMPYTPLTRFYSEDQVPRKLGGYAKIVGKIIRCEEPDEGAGTYFPSE
jgi:hypothetical protein